MQFNDVLGIYSYRTKFSNDTRSIKYDFTFCHCGQMQATHRIAFANGDAYLSIVSEWWAFYVIGKEWGSLSILWQQTMEFRWYLDV